MVNRMSEHFNNGDRWIKVVVVAFDNERYNCAINLDSVMCIVENSYGDQRAGRKASIRLKDGTILNVTQSFDDIGAMIR
jgi:hypothetical protein